MATFESFTKYLGLMPGEDTAVAQLCYDAAVAHAESVGIPIFLFGDTESPTDTSNAKLNLYIYAIAAHWYDKRSFEVDGFIQEQATKMRRELMYLREQETQDE